MMHACIRRSLIKGSEGSITTHQEEDHKCNYDGEVKNTIKIEYRGNVCRDEKKRIVLMKKSQRRKEVAVNVRNVEKRGMEEIKLGDRRLYTRCLYRRRRRNVLMKQSQRRTKLEA